MKRLLATTLIAAGLSGGVQTPPAHAAGATPFLGQIAWFAGNFAPRGWAFCDGQILPINQNQSLYSLLGTTYGGDGRTSFALPDMRSRTMIHEGEGPGLSQRNLGQKIGAETTTYTVPTMAAHNHVGTANASTSPPDSSTPENTVVAAANIYTSRGAPDKNMASSTTVVNTGGGVAVNNIQPSIAMRCIIALQGTFPSRN